jgi:hypothetical protein
LKTVQQDPDAALDFKTGHGKRCQGFSAASRIECTGSGDLKPMAAGVSVGRRRRLNDQGNSALLAGLDQQQWLVG